MHDEAFLAPHMDRQARKKRRTISMAPPTLPEVHDVVILVGNDVLHKGGGYMCDEVALPSDLVHHSGTAVSMLLHAANTKELQSVLNVSLVETYSMSCLHFEGGFFRSRGGATMKHGRIV